MAEKNKGELFSALMGEAGQDALQMMQRMERLKRLMGTAKPQEQPVSVGKAETDEVSFRNRNESMIQTAIPFLDRAYQKEIFVLVRLMEMRRVLQGGMLEVREKAEEPPMIRRRKLLGAIRPYLTAEEQERLGTVIRIMEMKAIMGQEGMK